MWHRRGLLPLPGALALCAFGVPSAAICAEISPPRDRVILTVTGALANADVSGRIDFDLTSLEHLGLSRLTTWTPWTDGEVEFEGILARRLMEAVGARGTGVEARALNDYEEMIPIEDFHKYDVLLAIRMNGALIEAFRHNAWATRYLLARCRDLSEEQLATSATGAYGDILATFNHYIAADAAYLRRLSGGEGPAWIDGDETDDFDVLSQWSDETAARWEQYLSQSIDAEKVYQVDDGLYEVRAGVIVTQALYHANIHREQICTILTGLGIEPPDMQPWEYAWDTGRIWERASSD
jgi:hypothetical protein